MAFRHFLTWNLVSYIFCMQTDGDITTSVESLQAIMEEEEGRKRSIRQMKLERHSQFSGTFTRIALVWT